jgi:hypothetical protein
MRASIALCQTLLPASSEECLGYGQGRAKARYVTVMVCLFVVHVGARSAKQLQQPPLPADLRSLGAKMAGRVGLAERLFEKFFYDFSMYKTHFAHKMDYNRYVAL